MLIKIVETSIDNSKRSSNKTESDVVSILNQFRSTPDGKRMIHDDSEIVKAIIRTNGQILPPKLQPVYRQIQKVASKTGKSIMQVCQTNPKAYSVMEKIAQVIKDNKDHH